jgi:hypothetical protein
MVKEMFMPLRPAIAMIELIFAIVIMGIVLMSAPMLISTASKSGYIAIQQEAINEAATQLNMILGFHWDENAADETYLDPILVVDSGDDELDENSTTGRRSGTPKESWRSYIREDGTRNISASAKSTFGFGSGKDGGESDKDDMDDFSETTTTLTLIGTSTDVDYTDTVSIANRVSYIDDNATYQSSSITFIPNYASSPSGTTNIKHIQVTLTSTSGADELNKTIILHAFSCNIGGYKLESKEF